MNWMIHTDIVFQYDYMKCTHESYDTWASREQKQEHLDTPLQYVVYHKINVIYNHWLK